jgi:hypothetical protein
MLDYHRPEARVGAKETPLCDGTGWVNAWQRTRSMIRSTSLNSTALK